MLYYIARFMASTHAGQKIIQNLASVSIMVFKIKARKRANLLFYWDTRKIDEITWVDIYFIATLSHDLFYLFKSGRGQRF